MALNILELDALYNKNNKNSYIFKAQVPLKNNSGQDIIQKNTNNYFAVVYTAFDKNFEITEETLETIKKEILWCFDGIFQKECHANMIVYLQQNDQHKIMKIDVFYNSDAVATSDDEIKIKERFKNIEKYKIAHFSKIAMASIESKDFESNTSEQAGTNSKEIEIWKTFKFDDRLLSDDNYLNNQSPFNRFYGINSQIRMVLSPLQSAIQTAGKRMVHSVLFGPPACGKTSVLNKLEDIIGKENILKLDAPTTTKAGIEKLFLNNHIPPVVILEEAEKANEDWLRNWLSLLDERSEIRKVNHKETIVKDIDILFYCTVNDNDRFNDLLDGALASRCKNKIYFPRPSIETIEKILYRDIQENGGKKEWVQPALQLAKDLNIDDPRIILSFLSGGDRLLTGSYQEDKKKCIDTRLIT